MAEAGKGDPRWIVEAREDGTNVNNWHWTEKNAKPWSESLWKQWFKDLVLENETVGNVSFGDVTKFDGDVTLSNRKGKVISYYEIVLEVKWEAKHENGEDKASGTLRVPNISEENDADDIEVEVTVKKSTPYGDKAKTLLRKEGLKRVQNLYGKFQEKLMSEYSQGMIKQKKIENKADGNAAAAAKVSAAMAKQENKHIGDAKPSGRAQAAESTSSVSHEQDIECGPDNLYACFTVAECFSAFTHSSCNVEPVIGKDFSLCNGYLAGKFLELDENKKIVMELRQSNWTEGVVSKATLDFKFKPDGGSTKLMVTHTGIPKSHVGECAARWKEWCHRVIRTFGYGSIPF